MTTNGELSFRLAEPDAQNVTLVENDKMSFRLA